ncbi:hypothetical protein VNO77_42367 [Canavalia gladiata]|uniref:Secreted protein n=1 Tax=Canavalia gladiata TaxID=3824 RepID=A0AAN9K2E1_CANGL
MIAIFRAHFFPLSPISILNLLLFGSASEAPTHNAAVVDYCSSITMYMHCIQNGRSLLRLNMSDWLKTLEDMI